MDNEQWQPQPRDKAWYCGDTEVIVVRKSDTDGIYDVRYARKDRFGLRRSRAMFAADRLELTPRA